MEKIHKQIQKRRKSLGFLQKDMEKLIGMRQAQYQKIEAGRNIKLRTLERILKALKLKMILVPNEELNLVMPFFDKKEHGTGTDESLSILERFRVLDDDE